MEKSGIKKDRMQTIALKTPYVFILLLMVIISPLGVYLFIKRVNHNKLGMYNKGRNLVNIGVFVIFLISVGLYSKIKEIIELYDSGMSLDMINFMPNNIWIYIIGIIIVFSYIYAGKKLMDRAKIEQLYTYRINIEHLSSIKKLSKELKISVDEAKENIKLLRKNDCLISIEIDEKKNLIKYINRNENEHSNKIKCSKCGSLVTFKVDEYVECDFCGHGMIDDK